MTVLQWIGAVLAMLMLGYLAVGAFILNMEEHEKRRKDKEHKND